MLEIPMYGNCFTTSEVVELTGYCRLTLSRPDQCPKGLEPLRVAGRLLWPQDQIAGWLAKKRQEQEAFNQRQATIMAKYGLAHHV